MHTSPRRPPIASTTRGGEVGGACLRRLAAPARQRGWPLTLREAEASPPPFRAACRASNQAAKNASPSSLPPARRLPQASAREPTSPAPFGFTSRANDSPPPAGRAGSRGRRKCRSIQARPGGLWLSSLRIRALGGRVADSRRAICSRRRKAMTPAQDRVRRRACLLAAPGASSPPSAVGTPRGRPAARASTTFVRFAPRSGARPVET